MLRTHLGLYRETLDFTSSLCLHDVCCKLLYVILGVPLVEGHPLQRRLK